MPLAMFAPLSGFEMRRIATQRHAAEVMHFVPVRHLAPHELIGVTVGEGRRSGAAIASLDSPIGRESVPSRVVLAAWPQPAASLALGLEALKTSVETDEVSEDWDEGQIIIHCLEIVGIYW